jgi:hypothetical protein
MKTAKYLLSILLLSSAPLVGLHAAGTPAGLVALWSGDGNALDSVGGRHGTLVGPVIYTDGVRDKAFDFTPNSRVFVPDHPAFMTPSFTLAGWLYPRVWGGFVLFRGDDRTGFDTYILDLYEEGKLGFSFSDQNGQATKISSPLRLNTWTHFAATFDDASGAMRLYTNGMLATAIITPSRPSLVLDNAQEAGIGIGNHGGMLHSFSLDGKVDELSIYSRALTAEEVASVAVSGPCTSRTAAAAAVVVNGFVVEAKVTDAGCGYTNTPLVRIVGGGGNGATAEAIVENGMLTGIRMVSAGSGYTTIPRVLIASPPFAPRLDIEVSKVKVTQYVVLGKNYVLEASADMTTWTQVGAPFKAEEEIIVQEFDIAEVGRFFRIHEVP